MTNMVLKPTEILETPQNIEGTITKANIKEIQGKNGPFNILEFRVALEDCPLRNIIGGNEMSVGYGVDNFNPMTRLGTLASELCGWDGESELDEQAFIGTRIAAQAHFESTEKGDFWNIDRNTVRKVGTAPRSSPQQTALDPGEQDVVGEIVAFIERQDKGDGVSLEAITKALARRKIGGDDAERLLGVAMDQGRVYEPTLGTFRTA